MPRKSGTIPFFEFRKEAMTLLYDHSPAMDERDWQPGTKAFMLQLDRFYEIFNYLFRYGVKKDEPVCLDVGCYPGDLGRLLRRFLPEKSVLYGAGLAFDADFEKKMNGIFSRLFYVELDPENPMKKQDVPNRIDLPDDSLDLITAGEIFEHFYSPVHFISEMYRLLKPGGILILTTPNLLYIGNVFRLLNGKSVFTDLAESHIFNRSEWRPHERIYTAAEIRELTARSGFTERKHFFMDNHMERFAKLSLCSRFHQAVLKPFYLIPHLRPQYIGVFAK